jgi:hypothetical protein
MAYPTITSRVNNVAMKLGNRQDLLQPAPGSGNSYSRIAGWLRDAYISISYSQTFEQTEQTLTFLTIPMIDTYSYPTTVRAIKSLVGVRQDSNTAVIVEWKDMNYLRRYTAGNQGSGQPFQGTPSIVSAFGNNVIFRPIPDNVPYLFYLDCWMKPVITTDVVSTQLFVPDDWFEVIDYEAAMRGHAELLERDKGAELARLLYGYTDPTTGAKIQGLTDRLQNRRQAQAPYVDYGLQPKYKPPFTGKR